MTKKYKTQLKSLLLYLAVFFGLILTYVLSLTIVSGSFQPDNPVTLFNYQSTAYNLDLEGDGPVKSGVRMDNSTDSLMINISWFTSGGNPFISGMIAKRYQDDDIGNVASLKKAVNDPEIVANQNYARYWHGYLITLKPLLDIHEYSEILNLNSLLFYLLFAFSSVGVYKRTNLKMLIAYTVSIAMTGLNIVAMSLQYSNMFTLMFIAVIVITHLKIRKFQLISLFFFILGSLTMFFDFYTYPYITLGFPMIVLMAIYNKELPDISNTILFKKGIYWLTLWFSSYLLTWIAKIFIGYLILGPQLIISTVQSVSGWLHKPCQVFIILRQGYDSIMTCVRQMMTYEYVLLFYPVLGILVLLFIIFHHKFKQLSFILPTIISAAFTLFWYFIAYRPTIIHQWFQYRGISVGFFALFYILLMGIDYSKILLVFNKGVSLLRFLICRLKKRLKKC